ncbi:unnamed protein product, partial [Owenia fusiformis]
HTPTNIVAVNIALVDLLQGLIATPMRLLMNYEYDIAKDIVYGAVMSKYFCIMRLGFSTIPCGLTLLLFIVMSVDRYIAIIYPFKYDKIKIHLGKACSLCWLCSGVMFVKPIIDLRIWDPSMICSNYSDWLPNHDVMMYIWIIVSVSISTGLHIQIQWIVHRHHNNIFNQIQAIDHNSAVVYKKGFRVLKSSILLFGFFIGMWGSFLLFRVLGTLLFGGDTVGLKIWHKVINKITLLTSFLNPIIFSLRQRNLKKAIRANCRIKCKD